MFWLWRSQRINKNVNTKCRSNNSARLCFDCEINQYFRFISIMKLKLLVVSFNLGLFFFLLFLVNENSACRSQRYQHSFESVTKAFHTDWRNGFCWSETVARAFNAYYMYGVVAVTILLSIIQNNRTSSANMQSTHSSGIHSFTLPILVFIALINSIPCLSHFYFLSCQGQTIFGSVNHFSYRHWWSHAKDNTHCTNAETFSCAIW